MKKIIAFLSTLAILVLTAVPVVLAEPPAGYEDDVETIQEGNPFSDTDLSTLEGQAADYLYRRGIIGGFPDGEFKGDRYVNRAELSKFLLLSKFGLIETDIEFRQVFSDIKAGEWYIPFVIRASEEGIINGYPDGQFRPAQEVNTVEFLKMFTITFGLDTDFPYTYTDVDKNSWYERYVGVAQRYTLFPDRESEIYPGRYLTRSEVAIAIYSYLHLIENDSLGDNTDFATSTGYTHEEIWDMYDWWEDWEWDEQAEADANFDISIKNVAYSIAPEKHVIEDGNDLEIYPQFDFSSEDPDAEHVFYIRIDIYDPDEWEFVDGCGSRTLITNDIPLNAGCGVDDFPDVGRYGVVISLEDADGEPFVDANVKNNTFFTKINVGSAVTDDHEEDETTEEPETEPETEPQDDTDEDDEEEETTEEPSEEEPEILNGVSYILTEENISDFVGDSSRAYVYAIAKNSNKFYVLDDETFEILEEITVGSKPTSIEISADNNKAYVANSGGSSISVINLESLEKEDNINTSIKPYDLEATETHLYATHANNQWGNGVIIDVTNNQEIGEFGSYFYPNSSASLYANALIELSPDEDYLYVTEKGLSPANIYQVDISNPQVPFISNRTAHGDIGSNLKNIKISNDGQYLYLAAGWPYAVQVVRTSDLKIEATMDTSAYPTDIAIYEAEDFLITTSSDNTAYIFDINDYTLVESSVCQGCQINAVHTIENKGLLLLLLTSSIDPGLQLITIVDLEEIE